MSSWVETSLIWKKCSKVLISKYRSFLTSINLPQVLPECEELVGAITGDGVTNLRRKPKLLFWRMCPVSFWFFLSTEGSFTDFKISLASFLFLHASVRLTSGQTPKASNFSFPMNWYFILQYMFPLWCRSRKRYTHKWSAWASWFYILYKIILKCVQTLPSPVITKWL